MTDRIETIVDSYPIDELAVATGVNEHRVRAIIRTAVVEALVKDRLDLLDVSTIAERIVCARGSG